MFRIMCLMLLALPLHAADFAISSYTLGASNFSLTFPTATGRIYGVERTESLGQTWTVQAAYCGTGADITFTDVLRPNASFYRVSNAPSPPLQLAPAGPTLTSGAVSLPDATIGESYTVDISACPSGTAPFSFQVSGAPPAGLALTVTSDSVQIRGAATTAARSQFQITVTDAANATVTNTYDLRSINPPPVIASDLVVLKAGQPADLSLASGGTGTLTWFVDSGRLPEGVALSASGRLSGTPTADDGEFDETGLHTAALRVSDQHTDRITGAPAPRSASRSVTCAVRLSYNLNIFADRADGPSFSVRCLACHYEGFPPNVVSGNALDIIGVTSNPASVCVDQVYIAPGEPEQSLIYKKLTEPQCADRMPQGGPFLTPAESNRLLRWIVELQPGGED